MRWLIAPWLALSLLTGVANADPLSEPEIWFNPHGTQDWLNMWTDDAPWQEAASKVNVLVLVDWWVLRATDAQLIPIIEFAKRHHMKLDLDTEAVAVFSFNGCGQGEGYGLLGTVAKAAQILARLGARLDYVDMDSPLYHGHYDTGPIGCQLSIDDTVSRVVMNLQPVFQIFPDAKLVDGEPCPTILAAPTWQQDMDQFYDGLHRQLGTPVRALQLDVDWNRPADWRQGMTTLNTYLLHRGIGLGVIWDGTFVNTSDTDWINSALDHVESVEGELKIIPRQVIFMTWNQYPVNNLPETSPAAQTWLINRYFRPRSTMLAQFVGQGAHGKLTTTDGKPIPNATVRGYKPGVNFSQPLPATVTTGVVPAGAVQAGFFVRVNSECGGCNGLNDLLFGTMQYQETQGGTAQGSFTYTPTGSQTANGVVLGTELVGGATVARIIAAPGQFIKLGGPKFPVTVGATYQLTLPTGTIGGLGWFGNIDLIWFDSSGSEIARVVVTPIPGKALISTAVTKADGTFDLFPMPRSVDSPNPVTLEFDGGDGGYRTSRWTPLQQAR